MTRERRDFLHLPGVYRGAPVIRVIGGVNNKRGVYFMIL